MISEAVFLTLIAALGAVMRDMRNRIVALEAEVKDCEQQRMADHREIADLRLNIALCNARLGIAAPDLPPANPDTPPERREATESP